MTPSPSPPLLRLPSAFLRRLHTAPAPKMPSCDVGTVACSLKSRSVVAFSGPDTFKFLQGLLTNDVRRLSGADAGSSSCFPTPNLGLGGSPAVYAAMLTPQGRFLYDIVLYKPQKEEEKLDKKGDGPGVNGGDEGFEVLADVDAAAVDELLACLKKYRLRSKVEIENVTKDFSCWQRFGKNVGVDSLVHDPDTASIGWGSGADRAGASAAQGNAYGWHWYKDPRLSSLGFRGIFPSCTIPPLVEADKEANEEHYLLWRIERGVAEGSLEIPKGEAIPLEYNLVGLNAISFDKGCYVGQEFVARTHHRGVIRKRLLPLSFSSADSGEPILTVAPGSEVVEAASEKKIGTVSTALGFRGIGVLWLDDAFKLPCLRIKNQHDVKVKVIKPDWWPAEWTRDLELSQTA